MPAILLIHPLLASMLLAIPITALAVCLLYGFLLEPELLRRRSLILRLPELPETLQGKRLLFCSDLHLGPGMPPQRLQSFLRQMAAEKADLLLFAGDLSENGDRLSEAESQRYLQLWQHFLQGESSRPAEKGSRPPASAGSQQARQQAFPDGVCAIYGNHDFPQRQGRDFCDRFWAALGVPLLQNSCRENAQLQIIGLDDGIYGQPNLHLLTETAVPQPGLRLVLLHEPDLAAALPQAAGPVLYLSGHSHNGQIRPFGLRLWRVRLGRRYPHGYYRLPGGAHLLVSAGLGTVRIHARFLAPPEYWLIELAREAD